MEGGVTDKGVSFALTPMKGTPGFKAAGTPLRGGGAGVTPSRVLLADCERKMNLLTPEHPNMLHHADIETQKIVSTWQFQKVRVTQVSSARMSQHVAVCVCCSCAGQRGCRCESLVVNNDGLVHALCRMEQRSLSVTSLMRTRVGSWMNAQRSWGWMQTACASK